MLACTKEGTISLNNTNDQLGAEIADSITVQAATYQLDPLPANGQGVMLVGKMSDEVTGDLTVSSYFRIGNAEISSVSLPSDARLDSVSFALPYQGYYYGDTTAMQSLTLHRVTEDIELITESNAWEEDERPVFASGSTLFTNSSFNYDAAPLGSVSFYPKPTSKDTVFIKLADSFGQDLWEKIQNKTSQVTSSEEFLQYMKGFVLRPTNEASVLTAFPVDSILLNVYYSYTNTTDGKKVQENIQMKVTDNTYQFNEVQVDRSRSIISQLAADTEGELPASETNQQVVLQGLTGLVTKIQFPYLYEFVNRNDVIINKAELIVETPANSQVLYAAPTALNIMLANAYGVPTSLLTASYETTTQTAYLINDLSGGVGNGRYTFNLTEYVSNYRGADEDKKSALYLTIPTSDLLVKADRLLIGSADGRPMIKLRILYTKY
ncbi:DUF4270 family protein [Olivibacter sp. XZL3]|uniref:DUF4270 family protein n=1 Tax=Olivibacter sp. XZL3 TaxID=1735116 RepID=UPI00141707D8|nr:DUF4270 family protein [Olivibacter sp. XZL3]